MNSKQIAERKEDFRRAWLEFLNLEGVDDDPFRSSTVADLVFIAQFEIDLVESGESEIDIRPHRKFINKWTRYSYGQYRRSKSALRQS